jgi:phosphoribosylglycinamide formyltransferase-1
MAMDARLPLRLAVLVSGRGSNLQTLLDRFHGDADSRRLAEVRLVLSDRDTAFGLERAERAGIDTAVVAPGDFRSPEEFGEKLIEAFKRFEVDYVVLAGFLRMIPENVIAAYRHRVINIHPALLPLFGGKGMYGRNVHAAVLESGMKVSGATVHFVDEKYDHGPIIAQETVPVRHGDTPESLADRVLEVEHALLPRVVAWLAEGRVSVRGRIVDVVEDD